MYNHINGGSMKSAGYIRRLMAEQNPIFDLNKMKNPSAFLQKWHGLSEQQEEQMEQHEDHYYSDHGRDDNIFEPDEVIDFNVGKPKKKKENKKLPKESDIDRENEKRREIEELKQKMIDGLKDMRNLLAQYKKEAGEDETKFYYAMKEAQKPRKKDKQQNIQQLHDKHRSNINKIQKKYPDLFQYIKSNKLDKNDLNSVYKHISTRLKKL
jgi:hypothetical protein